MMAPRNWLVGVGVSMFVHVMCARAALRLEPPPAVPPPPLEVTMTPREQDKPPAPEAKPVAPKRTPKRQQSAARAGRVIAAAPAVDDGPVDFSIVHGAATYVGGVTASSGTSETPVRGAVTAGAVETSAGTAVAASPEGSEWDCSALYPESPNAPDAAAVLVQVRTSADGRPRAVQVLRDPGHGFGAAAQACAMRQIYQPARDATGRDVPGETRPFLVRFHR